MAILDREQSYVALPQLEAEIKLLKERFANMLDVFYPVGSYYETSDADFDPNYEWGGVWELETAGQVHVSSGTGYSVSGALTNTSDGGAESHYLTPSETALKKHTHNYTKPPSSTDSFTLQAKHLPAHTHGSKTLTGTFGYVNLYSGNATASGIVSKAAGSTNAYTGASSNSRTSVTWTITATHEHSSVGQDTGHSHGITNTTGTINDITEANATSALDLRQPFIIVYRWHRTE